MTLLVPAPALRIRWHDRKRGLDLLLRLRLGSLVLQLHLVPTRLKGQSRSSSPTADHPCSRRRIAVLLPSSYDGCVKPVSSLSRAAFKGCTNSPTCDCNTGVAPPLFLLILSAVEGSLFFQVTFFPNHINLSAYHRFSPTRSPINRPFRHHVAHNGSP